jgi:hypothetical protein
MIFVKQNISGTISVKAELVQAKAKRLIMFIEFIGFIEFVGFVGFIGSIIG